MPTALKIVITKAIIEHSKYCGTAGGAADIGNNCAIAMTLVDIFPDVHVTDYHIFPFGTEAGKPRELFIPLPVIAQQFIKLFDGFCLTPRLRLLLPEFEFTVDIPDEVIDQINIDEIKRFIETGKKIHVSTPGSCKNAKEFLLQ